MLFEPIFGRKRLNNYVFVVTGKLWHIYIQELSE